VLAVVRAHAGGRVAVAWTKTQRGLLGVWQGGKHVAVLGPDRARGWFVLPRSYKSNDLPGYASM
jgi:hypothetical protein